MLVSDRSDFDDFLAIIHDAPVLVLDTETNITEMLGQRKMIGFSCAAVKGENVSYFYLPFRHRMVLKELGEPNLPLEWLEEIKFPAGKVYLFHNAKFDLQVFRADGIEVEGNHFDTMIMAHMVDENTSNALKTLGVEYLNIENAKEPKERLDRLTKSFGWTGIPPMVMHDYAVQDVKLTWLLYETLKDDYANQQLGPLWETEAKFTRLLVEIEERGIRIDRTQAIYLANRSVERMLEIQRELGFDPGSTIELARRLYGMPPEGLGLVPLALGPPSKSFPLGRPLLNEAALSRVNHPIAGLVLEYRGLQKAYSNWYRGWLDKADSLARLHPTFKQHGTVTGRMSCSNPNMQQIPREGADNPVKLLLRATDGYELWEFDYAQVEYRLAAVYAQEESLINDFLNGIDMHSSVAAKMHMTRYAAKTMNFCILYGGRENRLREVFGIPYHQASQMLTDYWSTYPRLRDRVLEAENVAEGQGYIKLWTGRRRHFRWPSEYRKAFNSAIQGGAMEIIKQSMVRIYDAKVPDFHIVNQVHDSIWVEIPKGTLKEYEPVVKEHMTDWTTEMFGIPFIVDAKKLAG